MPIRQPGHNMSQRQWRHDLDHDAESIFWLLVYWAMTVQPVECSIEDIDAGSWSYLLGTAAARQTLLLGLAQHQQIPGLVHSLYDPLRELIASLAAILVVDRYWLAESHVRNDPEYINEAFQRLILNFIITNSHEEWMGHSVEKRLRSVPPVPRADALSATASQDTNIAERKQPSPQPSSMSSTEALALMFSRSNHHQWRQQSSPPRPIRESLRSHSLKTSQPSTKNEPVQKTTNVNPTQHKKLSHTKAKAEPTNHTHQRPLSPPETPGPGTPVPINDHLQPAGLPTVAEDTCMLESLLESALAALIEIRSTPIPNSTPILSQTAKNTLAELNKLANATTPEASNGPNAQASLNSQGVQTQAVSTYADITKNGQAKPRKAHTKRPLPPNKSLRPPPQQNYLSRHSPYRLIVRWPGSTILMSATALTEFIDNLENDINPDFIYCKRPGT
jgi:hypothetical protein